MQRSRSLALGLAAISFLALFQELALIRYLPTEVRALAYFPNLILISAFLGLGVGALRAGRGTLAWLWPVALLATVVAGRLLSKVIFTQESASEHLWLLYYDMPRDAPRVGDVRPAILIAFALCALTFVPLGQQLAQRLEEFRALKLPLIGYCWDLLGSLLGVCLFAVACFFWTRPVIWFSAVAVIGALSIPRTLRGRLATGAIAAVSVLLVSLAPARVYTPYYALQWKENLDRSVSVTVNGSLHQQAIVMDAPPAQLARPNSAAAGYRVPYQTLGRPPGRVLVLGAGTGNDVAVALLSGADSVDAVEIDPGILDLGRRVHPNQPYSSPKVTVHNTDARSFLNGTRQTFDLIVFGTLDSMTNLSALSSVRLDNFVYTEECLRAAKARLSPDGGVVLYFMVGQPHVFNHILSILGRVFETPPLLDSTYRSLFNNIFMSGPAFAAKVRDPASERRKLDEVVAGVDVPTDDWPYLYLRVPGISPFYLSLIAIIAALSIGAVALASREMRQSITGWRRADWEMLLLGLGFLLLESASVTEMALTWGATWLTSAIVFAAVLLMVLIGTILRARFAMRWQLSAALLCVSLLLSWLVPHSVLLSQNVAVRLALSVGFVGTPIFFASTLFADSFGTRAQSDLAFGWNLLGAVLGGLLEFAGMAIGLRALHLLALAAYMLLVLLRLRSAARAQQAVPSPS